MLGNMDTYNSNNTQQPASIIISIYFQNTSNQIGRYFKIHTHLNTIPHIKPKRWLLYLTIAGAGVGSGGVEAQQEGWEVAATAATQHSGYNNIINNNNSSRQPAAGQWPTALQQRVRSKNVLFNNLESTSVTKTNGW